MRQAGVRGSFQQQLGPPGCISVSCTNILGRGREREKSETYSITSRSRLALVKSFMEWGNPERFGLEPSAVIWYIQNRFLWILLIGHAIVYEDVRSESLRRGPWWGFLLPLLAMAQTFLQQQLLKNLSGIELVLGSSLFFFSPTKILNWLCSSSSPQRIY